MKQGYRSLTIRYPEIVRLLESECSVSRWEPNWSQPELKKFKAIWDTGASSSFITQAVVDACDLHPCGQKTIVHHGGGSSEESPYLVNIELPNRIHFAQLEVHSNVVHGADVLIGMDIIGRGDFAVTNHRWRTVLSFRYPSIGHIDFSKGWVRTCLGKIMKG